MPLQKGGAAGSPREGGGRGPRDTAAAFQTRSPAPSQEGPESTRRVGILPGTAVHHQGRGRPAPPTRSTRGGRRGRSPRRSWGCQGRHSLDRAPPGPQGTPVAPRSWRCSPPGNHIKGVPFKREDAQGLIVKGPAQVSTRTCEPLLLNFDLHKQLFGFFFSYTRIQAKAIPCSSLLNFYGCKNGFLLIFLANK